MDQPLDGKVHVVVLQRPDVLGERCTVLALGVPKRLLVVVAPLFKGNCRESRVLLHTCVCFHGCLVYDQLGLALSFKGTELFVPTVSACSRFSFILGWTIPKDLAVVLIDNVCDTRHAAVTDLECTAVESLMQLGGFRKMLICKRAESPADICGNVAAVGWIVPGYFSPASPLTVFPWGWSVRNPFTVPALFQRVVIHGAWPQGQVLNRRSEFVSTCRHENKYYLRNYPPSVD